MKIPHIILFSIVVAGVAAKPHPPTTAAPLLAEKAAYDTRFDNIDVEEILRQERLLRNYVKCLENTGPCTQEGKMLKETLPDAISTDCSKCSETQKSKSDKVTHYLIDNRPDDWQHLERIYDPSATYRLKYLATKSVPNEQQTTMPPTSATTTTT